MKLNDYAADERKVAAAEGDEEQQRQQEEVQDEAAVAEKDNSVDKREWAIGAMTLTEEEEEKCTTEDVRWDPRQMIEQVIAAAAVVVADPLAPAPNHCS